MISFCKKNQIKHDLCGKILVASDDREISLLDNLADRESNNGLIGLKFLSETEFHQRGTAGVRAQAISLVGELLMDFNVVKENNQYTLPESWTRGLVKKSLNLTKRYDQTNLTQIHA